MMPMIFRSIIVPRKYFNDQFNIKDMDVFKDIYLKALRYINILKSDLHDAWIQGGTHLYMGYRGDRPFWVGRKL